MTMDWNENNRLATIQVEQNNDGQYIVKCIHWIGKPWDGFWQEYLVDEEYAKKILDMMPHQDVPETCAKCEYFWDFGRKPPYSCRLENKKMKIKTFSGETDPEKMTLEMINDDSWLKDTPAWCPLKDGARNEQD